MKTGFIWAGRSGTLVEREVLGPRWLAIGDPEWAWDPEGQGDGAGWAWDGRELSAWGDRLGFVPLFWWWDGESVAVSPNIVRLLALGLTSGPDWGAMGVFFRFGAMLGEDTPWARIRALPPGGRLSWREGRLVVSGRAVEPPEPARCSRRQALDRYVAAFRRAVERRDPGAGPFAVGLSGGRDSRHLVVELARMGRPPSAAFTWGPYGRMACDDVTTAARVAGALGLVQREAPRLASFAAYEAEKNVLTSFCAPDHVMYMGLLDFHRAYRAETGAACTFDGIGGDVLSNGLFLTPARDAMARRGAWRDLAQDMLAQTSPGEGALRAVVGRDAYSAMPRDAAVERLAAEIARYAGAANPTTMFTFMTRTRRMIALAPHAMYAELPRVYTPFLDRGVVDLLLALPAEHFLAGAFHDEAIALANPEVGALPYALGPSAKVKYRLSPASRAAEVAAMAALSVRLGGVRAGWRAGRWALANAAGRPDGRINRKWVSYALQLEALRRGGRRAACSQLRMVRGAPPYSLEPTDLERAPLAAVEIEAKPRPIPALV